MKRALIFSAAMLAIWLVLTAITGCSTPKIEYQPIPAMLVPPAPELPTVEAAELACLSDGAYLRLAARDRALRQYAAELAALLGVKP